MIKDITRHGINICFPKIIVYECMEDVPKKSWDIIFCRHTLEHPEEP